ncbi:MAG: ABC transporter permease [Lentisphaerae bacterium]|nr:ABC transporter permease [Lentisphaerota bacterium]
MRPGHAFFALAKLTAVEALRQPIVLLLFCGCVVLTALTPLLLLHAFGEYGKLARESGLACHFIFGLLVAVQAASSALAREVRTGTAAAVLSKPVGRTTFFLAKFAGVACVVMAFSIGAVLATLLSERVAEKWTITPQLAGNLIDWRTGTWLLVAPVLALAAAGILNYLRRAPFGSAAFLLVLAGLLVVFLVSAAYDRTGVRAEFDFRVDWRILPAGVLITAALLPLSALAASLSTRLATAPTLLLCGLVFVLGLLWEFWFGPAPATPARAWLYSLVPNWQHFWVSDALTGGGTIPWPYVARAVAYAATYTGAVLALGALAFEHTDV